MSRIFSTVITSIEGVPSFDIVRRTPADDRWQIRVTSRENDPAVYWFLDTVELALLIQQFDVLRQQIDTATANEEAPVSWPI